MRIGMVAVLAAAVLLAGCENDAASYQTGDGVFSITVIREQRLFWDKKADVAVVVGHLPDCQRRHALRATHAADSPIELFQAGPQAFLLRQGNDWHLADGGDCSLKPAAPPQAGAAVRMLGTFERRTGRLAFTAPAPGG